MTLSQNLTVLQGQLDSIRTIRNKGTNLGDPLTIVFSKAEKI